MQVKLKDIEKIRVLNADDIYSIMQRVLLREKKIERNKEHFWIIGLAANNRILYVELISLGTITATLIEPMEVFSIALQKQSTQIIMVHNHPSGSVSPSEADQTITDRMIQIGNFLSVPVIDHLIISESSFYSFEQSGLMKVLRDSKRFVIPYKEQERLLAEKKAEGEQLGITKAKIEMVRKLKEKNVDIEIIRSVTGLSIAEIKKIRLPRKS